MKKYMKCIIGKKLGMTTLYDAEKGAISVTLLDCASNSVELVRNQEKDGYDAVQVSVPKTNKRILKKEFRFKSGEEIPQELQETGRQISVEAFEIGDRVSVSGVTKAKGFQGVVKRHGFSGSPQTHGHRHDLRAPGSIGSSFPEHVIKGKKMAGRMGGNAFTVSNLKVAYIDKDKNIIGVQGAVPGVSGNFVKLQTL